MGIKPWMTSAELIEAVKRKIAVPLNQRTFTETDILSFANEELMISQVPDILQYHEEYFVYSEDVELQSNVERYPIPEPAMGMKLRDIFYVDNNGNLFEMTRINPDDKSYWQRESSTINLMQKYYIENNDVVLAPFNISQPTGSLRFTYFLRPNQLVLNERAAISEAFVKNVTVNNANLVAGNTLTIGNLVFTAVAGSPNALEFQIGASSILSAANLVTAINTDGTYNASNGSSAVVAIEYQDLDLEFESNSTGMVVSSQIAIQFTEDLSDHYVEGLTVDFLQTKPGHKLLAKDVILNSGSVSTNSILFDADQIPEGFEIGDYICEQYECIIPMIPPDLHNGLAERVGSRILAAQGDLQGLQISVAKIGDIKRAEGTLVDNRVDGSTPKVNQRKSLLSYGRMGVRRRI